MKLVELLKQLPEQAVGLAINNMQNQEEETKVTLPSYGLCIAFNWTKSPEGFNFWSTIYKFQTKTEADARQGI